MQGAVPEPDFYPLSAGDCYDPLRWNHPPLVAVPQERVEDGELIFCFLQRVHECVAFFYSVQGCGRQRYCLLPFVLGEAQGLANSLKKSTVVYTVLK